MLVAVLLLGLSLVAIAAVLDDFGPSLAGDVSAFTGPLIGEDEAIDDLGTGPRSRVGAFSGPVPSQPRESEEIMSEYCRGGVIALVALLGLAGAAMMLWGGPATADSKGTTEESSGKGGSVWGANYFPNVPLTTHDGREVRFFDDLIKDKVVARRSRWNSFLGRTCNRSWKRFDRKGPRTRTSGSSVPVLNAASRLWSACFETSRRSKAGVCWSAPFAQTSGSFAGLCASNAAETDPEKLAYHVSDAMPHIRVDECQTCHGYLKTVDLRKDGRAVPVVEDLASVGVPHVESGLRAEDVGTSQSCPPL